MLLDCASGVDVNAILNLATVGLIAYVSRSLRSALKDVRDTVERDQ